MVICYQRVQKKEMPHPGLPAVSWVGSNHLGDLLFFSTFDGMTILWYSNMASENPLEMLVEWENHL